MTSAIDLAAPAGASFFRPRAPLPPQERLARTEGAAADVTRRIKRALKRRQPVDHLLPLLARYAAEAAALRALIADLAEEAAA
jgi:hypothetical protein